MEKSSEVYYEKPSKGAHVLALTYPLVGHINPMLQFSKRLASKGLQVTVLITTSATVTSNLLSSSSTQTNSGSKSNSEVSNNLDCLSIFDGFISKHDPNIDPDVYLDTLTMSTSKSLEGLLEHYKQNNTSLHPTPKMVIYDAFMPWILQVVHKCGFEGAPIFTQSCVVNSIYYHAYKGSIISPKHGSDLVSLPSIESLLRVDDLPSFVAYPSLYPAALIKLLFNQFSNLKEANCLFVNSLDTLEIKVEVVYEKPSKGAHVLVVTYPLQSHINPMLQFAKRLASKGLKVTIIITSSFTMTSYNQLLSSHNSNSKYYSASSLDFLRVFDGFSDKPDFYKDPLNYDTMEVSTTKSMESILEHYSQNTTNDHPTPKMVIYDAFMHWMLLVVKKYGLEGAPFFTQSCLVNSVYYHVYNNGLLKTPKYGSSDLVSLPSIGSLLRVNDLPSIVACTSLYPPVLLKLLLNQFSNLNEVNCLFVNTMDMPEIQVINWMTSQWPVKTIGPCIPSMYLDKRLPNDKDYGLSLFQPQTDACIQWLDARDIGSVVYISMGSLASLGSEQMQEIAKGLENCNKFFLWVVRASEEEKLPLNFKEKVLDKGLIINWCPQLKVLAHHALGCFVTHCGWNSTLEAISLGVPMVAFPQWTDQPTNAKCIVDFWKIGVRVKVDEKGFLKADEIECCIREVMEGERAKEIKSNAVKWKQLTKEAMEEGGSSERNIEEFVTKLLNS